MTTTILNAEQLIVSLARMPSSEREKFFSLLLEKTNKAFEADNCTHEQVFGHLTHAEFTAAEAADYLEISMATFRRHIKAGNIKASVEIGSSHLYSLESLRAVKNALALARRKSKRTVQNHASKA